MGPKGDLRKNDNPQFINPIGIYENHNRVNLGPIASEVAGFCGAFLGALAGRRSNQQQKFPPAQSTETKSEISEISSRIAPVGHSD